MMEVTSSPRKTLDNNRTGNNIIPEEDASGSFKRESKNVGESTSIHE